MTVRFTPRAAALAVLAVLLGVLLASALVIMSHRSRRRAGTNLTTLAGFVIPVGPGQHLCESGELVPADTAELELFADTKGKPGPELEASIAGARNVIATGRLEHGWSAGRVRIPIRRVAATTAGTVCVRNLDAVPVTFGGSIPDSGFQSTVGGRTLDGRMRIEYLRPGRESWFELLPTIAYRFSLGKSGLIRHWAAIAAVLLMLATVVLAIGTAMSARTSR